MKITEISRLSGISVRTLHHYDAIGLLKPSGVTGAGYRLYDDAAIARLQEILLLRELMFPLKDIKALLDSPGYNRRRALDDQIKLLELKRERLDGIIARARRMKEGELSPMDMNTFDNREFEKYAAEAKQHWGSTGAYADYEKRAAANGPDATKDAGMQLMEIIAGVAAMRPLPPDNAEVAAKARTIQQFISANFYECTDEIFIQLAEIYTGDPRMKANIDSAAGDGAAEYVSSAIKACFR